MIITIIFLSISLFAQQIEVFKIVNPPNTQIYEESNVGFVIETNNEEIDLITISVVMGKTYNIQTNPTNNHYCKNINIHLGENIITISGYKQNNLLKQEVRMIFLTSKVHKEYKYPPQQYENSFFHNDINEKTCAKCHDMSVNEVKNIAFRDITESNCYQCHNLITTKKHAHAPAVNWLCTSCHTGEVGKFNKKDINKTKYSVFDPIGNICLSCHEKNKHKWNDKRFHHEPIDSGRCNKCHNSHSQDNEFYLRKSVWELCTGCHKDKIEGTHIIKTFGRKKHPTHKVKDPSRPGKDLSCISCHNPHASNTSSLLQSSSVFGLCSRCHKK